MIQAATRRAGVLGSPIGHSLSPTLHTAAYEALGLTGWTYQAYEVTEPDLADFLAGVDGSWAGLSLTMPLKAAVLPLLDGSSPVVEAVAAANTVLLTDGRRLGENTDVPGMVASLAAHDVRVVPHATVLGGGATARSALAALAGVTGSATAYVRSSSRRPGLTATAEAVGLSLQVRPWSAAAEALGAPLVVNTTTAGAADPLVAHVPRPVGTLLEVLYDPWPTPLAAAWGARGGLVVDGLDLLVHQAVLQVGLMTGAEVDVPGLVDLLRAAGERALRSR
ncbi:MAG TPA: shikimate dehydrogenase [Actinomycetes bacterium]